jgi:hypothetical protein
MKNMAELAAPETKSETNPSVTLPAGEWGRLLSILIARGGGTTPFATIGLRVYEDFLGFKNVVEAEYVGGTNSGSAIKAWFPVHGPVSPGEIATNDPVRLIDYLDGGLFGPEEAVTVRSSDGRLYITGSKKHTSMGAADAGSVPRTKFANAFTQGPGNCFVNTNADHAPKKADDWNDWVQAGYVVAQIPKASIDRLLKAGSMLHKRYANAVYTFHVTDGALTATLQETRDKTADLIELQEIAGAQVLYGSPDGRIPFRYDVIEPFWSSLKDVHTTGVIMVTNIAKEHRVNFIAGEDFENAEGPKLLGPKLRLTQIVGTWDEVE